MTEPNLNAAGTAADTGFVIRTMLKSDVGRVRSENQDAALVMTGDQQPDAGCLMIVADGMGGYRGGATASRMAVASVKAEYLGDSGTSGAVTERLRNGIVKANTEIYREAQARTEFQKMGTTCSVLVIRGGEAHVAHVGDSRVYRIRDGAIEQLTEDHSLVATMVREGLLTSTEAETHPRRNVLHRAVGVAPEVEIDLLPPMKVRPGDCFVLCSDGLHGVVKDGEILDLAGLPPEQAAEQMVNRALSRGAPDNVTVIVARADPQQP